VPVATRVVQIADAELQGCYYLNPEVTVYSQLPSLAFARQVRKCQAAWCRRFGKVVGASAFRRQARSRAFFIRQLAYQGILIADGKWIAPQDWQRILTFRSTLPPLAQASSSTDGESP
jgi:hypothetical protein